MARTPRGKQVLEKAKELLSKARTVEKLSQARAVILPLDHGFSMEHTGAVIGVPKGWASHLRQTPTSRTDREQSQKGD
jgi:hypothetical protein